MSKGEYYKGIFYVQQKWVKVFFLFEITVLPSWNLLMSFLDLTDHILSYT